MAAGASWPSRAFTVDQVSGLLNGMTVKEHRIWLQKLFQGEAPLVPVFKDEEVALLAPQLAEAFAAFDIQRTGHLLSEPAPNVGQAGDYVRRNVRARGPVHRHWQIVYGIPIA